MVSDAFYIGVDVGTGSARAGVFDSSGVMLGSSVQDIRMWKPHTDHVEQSSDDIWEAVCSTVRAAVAEAGVSADQIRGLGFDATCSLVALDAEDRPVAVNDHGLDAQNVIVWMDHRATEIATEINSTRDDVLRYVGGGVSPEMEIPKLLWLKRHLPDCWQRTARFFDLPDFLTYRATGDDTRSLCSTVCKWNYLGHEPAEQSDSVGHWAADYLQRIGLEDLSSEQFQRIGTRVRPMGEPIGQGLSAQAAQELGLAPGTAVGVSIIDAHAGGIGMLGAPIDARPPTVDDMDARIALIGGTSSCHMAVSLEPRFIPGVWGPYYSAMIPDLWLTEGGQSATGALIDHVIESHAQGAQLQAQAESEGSTVYDLLNARLDELAEGHDVPAELTQSLHVLPYFHGNRSPRADATLRGVVSGLRLSSEVDDLALLYLATIQAIAHGTRHIIESLNAKGYRIDTIIACGGGTKNPVFLREHADITGCRIILPAEPEAVLLGSAILGATASGAYDSLIDAMGAMNRVGETIESASGAVRQYHDAKYAVFQRMHDDFMAYREMMASAAS
ncbi:MAG: FGGY-family carbohydrate kinase [Gemmatimonadetes bacterium]|jgi:FGGY-family pentulose kinase|nr:FGGY-family carbohydrate kinase [Gemmatimonadota bacterium]MBT6145077.1 FGGY-family carbohydrate kinase [Gemmatimonadota bacterium]MBT7861087.1 FGGY-family carbohydrate kinase [Gemmatimonadota bacterium]